MSMPLRLMGRVVVVLASLVALAGPMHGAAAADAPPAGLGYGRVIEAALHEFHVPGAAVAIYTPDHQWVRTFGLGNVAKGRPVGTGDYFAIRSVTKSFVVTAVLQLIAASHGAVTLDDAIGKYLPNVPDGEIITIRELAGMTSGLYNYVSDEDFVRRLSGDPLRHWAIDELLRYALHSSKHPAIVFPPGTQYQYSNTNTLLLGQLVEVLSGRNFEAVLEGDILTPLGLSTTRYLTAVALPRPSVTGYQDMFEDAPVPVALNPSALSFAGAMAATIGDLATWGTALANGTLLPHALQRERFMARPIAADPNSPLYDRYGLGMGELGGWWGHTGNGVGFQAAVFHQIALNETIAILLNGSTAPDVPAHIFCRLLPLLRAGQHGTDEGHKSACDSEPR